MMSPIERILKAYKEGRDELFVFVTRQRRLPDSVREMILAIQQDLGEGVGPRLRCGESFDWVIGDRKWIRGVLAQPGDMRTLMGKTSRDGTHVYVCSDVPWEMMTGELRGVIHSITIRDFDTVDWRYDDEPVQEAIRRAGGFPVAVGLKDRESAMVHDVVSDGEGP